jgi:hypothetical protein
MHRRERQGMVGPASRKKTKEKRKNKKKKYS